jgi:hypothetical protein
LTVKGLPALTSGHYEVWLFSSVVDDRRLGQVASGSATVTFPLPAGARHYRWIDITLQPKGSRSYSGESKLRARNPVEGPKSVLHAHRARVPRKLTHTRQRTTTHHAKRSTAKHRARRHKTRPAGKRRTAAHA